MAMEIVRGARGQAIGISVMPGTETCPKDFVKEFPHALLAGEASVFIEGNKAVFRLASTIHVKSGARRIERILEPEDLEAITGVLQNPERRLKRDGSGFKIVVDE